MARLYGDALPDTYTAKLRTSQTSGYVRFTGGLTYAELDHDFEIWCNENLKGDWEVTILDQLRFSDPSDFVLYRLTWEG